MAYKILCTLLPLDIVNGIMEYIGHTINISVFHLYKIYNVLKISCMGTYMNLLIINKLEPKSKHTKYMESYCLDRVCEIKKNSYAEIHVEFMKFMHLIKIQMVISTVPNYISYSMRAYSYIYKYGIKCINCIRSPRFCINCDFSQCKDSEIMSYACK